MLLNLNIIDNNLLTDHTPRGLSLIIRIPEMFFLTQEAYLVTRALGQDHTQTV